MLTPVPCAHYIISVSPGFSWLSPATWRSSEEHVVCRPISSDFDPAHTKRPRYIRDSQLRNNG